MHIFVGILLILVGAWALYTGVVQRQTRHYSGGVAVAFGVIIAAVAWTVATIVLYNAR